MAERRLDKFSQRPLDLLAIVTALEEDKIDYVIIGGFAGLIHGMPLPTYDVDIMLSPEKKYQNKLLQTMERIGATPLPEDESLSANEALIRQTDVSFATPHGYLDVVAQPAGFANYRVLHRNARRIQLSDNVEPFVASLRDVVHSKRSANRERDIAQLPALETVLRLSSLEH